MTFLAIDVGNTRLKWARYSAGRPDATLLDHGAVFLETIDTLCEAQWRALEPPEDMLGCIVAGTAVRRRVEEQLEIWDLVPQWIVPQSAGGGVSNRYDHPHRLGADRWAAVVGARNRLVRRGEGHRPVVVVMVGTAVTVDAVDAQGHFVGGLILPGFGLMLRALEMGTAGLRVPTGEVHTFPTNTSDALMSGGTYAIAGAIERMARELTRRCSAPPVLMFTGGAVPKLAPVIELPFEVVDTLIFDGLLALAAERPATSRFGAFGD
jgi:type III pantothenate kinase